MVHRQGRKACLYTTWAVAVKRTDDIDGSEFIFETSVSVQHPDKYAVAGNGLSSMQMLKDPESRFYPVAMPALGYHQVRSAFVDYYAELLEETGADGFQIESLCPPTDTDGVSIYGYEQPIVAGFQETYGQAAHTIPNSNQRWIDFRCHFSVLLIEEIRHRLDTLAQKVTFSTVGYSLSDHNRDLFPWQTIVQQQLVDEFYFRVSPLDPYKRLEEINQARIICEQAGVPFIPSFDLKSYGNRSLAKQKAQAVEVCVKSLIETGIKRIAIYGSSTTVLVWQEILDNLKK